MRMLAGRFGMATTIGGALMALAQTEVERLRAFSSMRQLGDIVPAIARTRRRGWVTARYMLSKPMLVTRILFSIMAGVILRAGTGRLDRLGNGAGHLPLVTAPPLAAWPCRRWRGAGGTWCITRRTGLPTLRGASAPGTAGCLCCWSSRCSW